MKKILLALLVIVCFCLTAEAKTYVTLHKTTGEPQGVSSIADENVADWAENFILIEADESYRGKHGWEIKYKNQKLYHATKIEKDAYKAQKKQEQDVRKKADALETIGLDESDIQKIKNIQIAMKSGGDTSLTMVTPAFIQYGKILFGLVVDLLKIK